MPSSIHGRIDPAAIRRLATNPAGPIYRDMVTRGARVETQAKINASGSIVRVRSGNLRSSIQAAPPEIRGNTIVVPVVASAAYAYVVHEGSRPHLITARPGSVLAWRGPNGPVFTRRVRHPGTQPRPFLRRALDAAV